MKRKFSLLLNLLIVLTLSACELIKPNPPTVPSLAATTQPSPVPGCSSGRIAAPEVVDTWSPSPEAASIMPLSCDEIGDLFAYDPLVPLDVQEVSQRWEEGVTLIDLTYASPMGGLVPATLVVPDGEGPFAGMLYLHGMPDSRQTWIPTAVAYARMGAIVLLIDAPFARRENGFDAPLTFGESDRREQIQLIIDLRRGIDILLTLPEVDPERLAYAGYSYGGMMGGLLAGVEDRLKAYVLQVSPGGIVTHLTDPMDRGVWMARSENLRQQYVAWMWPIEPIHYVGCASPAAVLFQNGTLDIYALPADGLRYQEAGSEPKTALWYHVGHKLLLDGAAFRDQTEWLSEMIGISVGQLEVPVDLQVLAEYAGRYEISTDTFLTICVNGTRIVIQGPDYGEMAGDFELLAVSENHFHMGASGIEITFYRNDHGEVDRMVVAEDDEMAEAMKVP